MEVKDTEITKLRERNAKLEMLMKKAVKIMQNPQVMKFAFKRFNFDKVVYTKTKSDSRSKLEIIQNDSDLPLSSVGTNSVQRGATFSDVDRNKKDLILVEAHSKRSGHDQYSSKDQVNVGKLDDIGGSLDI